MRSRTNDSDSHIDHLLHDIGVGVPFPVITGFADGVASCEEGARHHQERDTQATVSRAGPTVSAAADGASDSTGFGQMPSRMPRSGFDRAVGGHKHSAAIAGQELCGTRWGGSGRGDCSTPPGVSIRRAPHDLASAALMAAPGQPSRGVLPRLAHAHGT